MRTLVTLVRKDIANFLRNRTALSLTFIVPIALIYVFGQVFGLNRKDSGPSGIALGVVDASSQPAAKKLITALRTEKGFRVIADYRNPDGTTRPMTEADARRLIHDHAFNFAIVIPRDLLPDDRIGIHLRILSNPRNDIETQMVTGLLQKTIFSNVPELLGESLQNRAKAVIGDARVKQFNREIAHSIASAYGGDADKIQERLDSADYGFGRLTRRNDPDPTLRRLDLPLPAPTPATAAPTTAAAAGGEHPAQPADVFSRIVTIDTEQIVGKDVKSPEATRIVGGWAIMFLLFAISGSSAAFFDEKNTGIFQRLLSAPVTRAQLLSARFIFGIILGLVQLVTLFGAGRLMYGIDVMSHFGSLIVVCIAAAAACTSFGMAIAAFSPNAAAANGLATFLVLLMSATGGAWFPMSLMPQFMQTVGKFTIVYWSMEGFSGVLWAGNTFVELLPIIGVLVAITIGVMAISIWRLNRKAIFG